MRSAMAKAPGFRIAALGVYFAFAELSLVEAARRLSENYGVAPIPGAFFGDGLDAYLRIAFANSDVAEIDAPGARLKC